MIAKLRSWWQKIKQHPFIATGIILILIALIAFIFAAYRFGWDWSGFNSGTSQITVTSTSKVNYTATVSQPSKSLWDWLQLLSVLAIPVVVGFGAVWFTTRQGKVAEAENKDNQHEAALQEYIDKMSELLLKEHLGERTEDGKLKPEYEQVRNIARVRTITVLTQLDARRIGYVFAFLREAGLMSKTSNENVVSLQEADLRGVQWSHARLDGANLAGANLRGANLERASLYEANLSVTFLADTNLSRADLRYANLSRADPHYANPHYGDLSSPLLIRADLSGADLQGANLSGADLRGAKVTPEQLDKANSLNGATMPDGSEHA